MEERTVKWLWNAAALLDQTSPSVRLISRHLREMSASGRWLKPVKDELGVPELCPKCLTPWSIGQYSLKLVPLNRSKNKNRVHQRLLKKDSSTLNHFQVTLLKRIKPGPANLMRITCKVCKKVIKVYLKKSNSSCLEKTNVEVDKEVTFDSIALEPGELLPNEKKKKKKKRKKDALCGLKLSAVSQVKRAKVQSRPTSDVKSVTNGSSNSTHTGISDSRSTVLSGCNSQKESKSPTLPLVNPVKVIASHDKIKKSLEQIFYNLEKDCEFDSGKKDIISVSNRDSLSKNDSNEVIPSSFKNLPPPDNIKVKNLAFKSPNKHDWQETSSGDQLSNCNSEKNKNKRLQITKLNDNIKRLKTNDLKNPTCDVVKVEKNYGFLKLNLSEQLSSIQKTNKTNKGILIKQSNGKKIILFSQPSDNMIQREVCTNSNGKTQNQISNRNNEKASKKIINNNNTGIKTTTNGKDAATPNSKLSKIKGNQKNAKNQKKKSKNNKRGKTVTKKNSNNYRSFEESKCRDSLSVSDLLSLT